MSRTFPLTFAIETPRLRLRVPWAEDIPFIFEATRHPGFNDGMVWDAPTTLQELEEPLRKALEAWRAGTAFTFSIIHRQTDEFLGRIAIRAGHDDGSTVKGVWNIGFFLHPDHQGKGYMREAAGAVLRLGFEKLGATIVEAYYATWNKASESVLHAIGMSFVANYKEGFKKQGRWVEENKVAITRLAWEGRE
jgi:ribosomal-protein-alanine N-acetyltransferase